MWSVLDEEAEPRIATCGGGVSSDRNKVGVEVVWWNELWREESSKRFGEVEVLMKESPNAKCQGKESDIITVKRILANVKCQVQVFGNRR